MAVPLTGFGITALMGSILPFPSLLPLPPFSISDKSRSLPPSTDRPTLVAHFRKLVLKCTNARLELLIHLNYERTWWVSLFYLWMTRRDLTMLIYDNSALESPAPSIQHCHQSDCRAHHRGRERVIPFFPPKVPFKLSQQPQKKKEKRKETDFPPVIPPSLCALPISSQEVACPSHLDLSATGDDDKSCANFHIQVLDRAPSGLVNTLREGIHPTWQLHEKAWR